MRLKAFLKHNLFALSLAALGLIIAILFLLIGFWRTMLILLLIGGGAFLGYWLDHSPRFGHFTKSLLPPGDADHNDEP